MIRLDKYLADMGAGTRTEVKKAIRKGMVSVDGIVAGRPEEKIDANLQKVSFQGHELGYAAYEYYMLNKPAGTVSATRDKKTETVLDLIESKKRKDLFPVGRLDKDTEGLLLITNDGMLAHELLSPKKHVDKTYYAKVTGCITKKECELFLEGLDIADEKKTLPAKLVVLHKGDISEVTLTIHEGRFHQVKRMFEAVGSEVIYLKRISMGSLKLDETLAPGAYRELTKEELEGLCYKK
ncbi:MAG: pseudouridine synthase [Lachnospiraceae bacterium]